MRTLAPLVVLVGLLGCASADRLPDRLSDAPEQRPIAPAPVVHPATYAEALAAWRGPEDVNAWIGANFRYDVARALALSESQRAAAPSPQILDPQAFYADPAGMCVDLARFAVETIRHLSPGASARYLMIEFEPVHIRGELLRRHWVAVYEGHGGILVTGDSKRPGLVAGPYRTVDEFVAAYATFRGRNVVSYRELDGYQRKLRVRAPRRQGA